MKLAKQVEDKKKEGEAAFRPNCFVSKQFSKNFEVYGEDREMKKK